MAVSSGRYYSRYDGHDAEYLGQILTELRRTHSGIVFLAGDSSLDNKHWFNHHADAINGYEDILTPPRMKTDVCYWLNREASRRAGGRLACLNTAIEATSLNNRACCRLLEQDEFIRDNITPEDYLIVSVGGNDIALQPLLCTVLNLLMLSWCVPVACLDHCACACPPNTHLDGGCATCGLPGCLCGLPCGWPPGIGYFVDLFGNRVKNYVAQLVDRTKPKKVVICMIYYLDEVSRGSWAECALGCMGYNCFPYRLQAAISTIFRLATERIRIPGTEVVGFPLFKVLDGKTPGDYVQRVEPSPEGGRKMAAALLDALLEASAGEASGAESAPCLAEAPVPVAMGRP